jgi:hypothetical protein
MPPARCPRRISSSSTKIGGLPAFIAHAYGRTRRPRGFKSPSTLRAPTQRQALVARRAAGGRTVANASRIPTRHTAHPTQNVKTLIEHTDPMSRPGARSNFSQRRFCTASGTGPIGSRRDILNPVAEITVRESPRKSLDVFFCWRSRGEEVSGA